MAGFNDALPARGPRPMATSGDQYTYSVIFDARNGADLAREAKSLDAFNRIMAETTAAADRVAPATARAAAGVKGVGSAADGIASAGQRAGHTISQLAYIMDDAAYGARGLRNQVMPLATSLLGFGVAGAAAGAAGTVLVGVFGDQIDAALAYAGVLDENLIKAMERGEEKTESFADRLAKLREEFADDGKAATENASSISQAFIDAGKASEDAVARMIGAMRDPDIDKKREELEQKYERLAEGLRKAEEGAIPFVNDGAARQLRARLADVDKQLQDLADSGGKALADLRKEAVTSDDALVELAAAARLAGESDLAKALEAQTRAAKATAKAVEEAAKEVEEAEKVNARAAEEAERRSKAEIERRRREAEAAELKAFREMQAIDAARQAAERAEMDDAAGRAFDAFNPLLGGAAAGEMQSRVRAGQGVDDAAEAVQGRLVQIMARAGVGADAAEQAARQMVEGQARELQGLIDGNNAVNGLLQQMLGNQGLLGNMILQDRAERQRMEQAAEQMRRQFQQHNRRWAPMRFLQGNRMNGFF